MKALIHYWGTGMALIGLGAAPFTVLQSVLKHWEPELVNGGRPLWWRTLSVSAWCIAILVAPLVVRFFAQAMVRLERRSSTRTGVPVESPGEPPFTRPSGTWLGPAGTRH